MKDIALKKPMMHDIFDQEKKWALKLYLLDGNDFLGMYIFFIWRMV